MTAAGQVHTAVDRAVLRLGTRLRQGVVSTVSPLTITLGGDTTAVPATTLDTYMPAAGSAVQVLVAPGASPLVLGSIGTGRTGCRLRRAANQSINSGASTAVSWDTEDQDTHGYIAVTGTTITIPAGLGGLYAVLFRGGMTLTGSGRNFAEIAVTSTITGMPADFRDDMATVENRLRAAYTGPLLAGDSFVINVFQASGSAQNLTAWLSCYRIGA